jgi:hypothetical protein
MLDRLRFAPYRREVELEKRDAGDYQREPNPIVNVPPNGVDDIAAVGDLTDEFSAARRSDVS